MWPVPEILLGVLAVIILVGFLSGPASRQSNAEAEVQRTVGEIVANLRTYASENPGDVTCAALNNAADRIKAEFGGAK